MPLPCLPPSDARASRRRFTRMLAAAGAAGLLGSPALRAQSAWPSRPVRLVIPFPAGGATDIIGRVVAMKLSQALGQQVIVDNRPGVGGTIGADAVAKAAPDGYTLLLATSSTHSIGPVLNPKMPYDAIRDFTPIINVAEAPSVLVVGASSPAADARGLITLLKGAPGRYNFGSSGIGTYPHLAAEMFKWRAGNLFVVHIPYRGTGLVIPDLVTGQIAFLMDSIVSAQPHIRDGKVRALAVSGARRSSSLPNVPTFAEIGVQGMAISNWFGMFGPAGLPADIVARVNREMNTLIASADVIERFEKTGAEPRGGTPQAFAKLYADEMQSWKAVIQRANIRPE
ncbi:MAG TPA: tripartite tricarboxylate transporter substrate binding protein [Burkholderiaceae bacterium]|nr:tripartite tricarboxylate transporter substrate binding protein [Burkholderiaceae bacterium]